MAKLAFGEREGEKYVERENFLPFLAPQRRTNDFRPENETDTCA